MPKKVEDALDDALSNLDSESFSARILKTLTPVGNCNTSERAYEIRMLLENPEVDDYPVLSSIEEAWQFLVNHHYPEYNGRPLISRVELSDIPPLDNFEYHVEMGFYPPPEIMMAIQLCFHKYLASGGDISLDEAFFGTAHKKRDSYAYQKNHKWKFGIFHNLYVVLRQRSLEKSGEPCKSMEALAEEYLTDLFSSVEHAGIDIDTFLRGYRRWKNHYKMGKDGN